MQKLCWGKIIMNGFEKYEQYKTVKFRPIVKKENAGQTKLEIVSEMPFVKQDNTCYLMKLCLDDDSACEQIIKAAQTQADGVILKFSNVKGKSELLQFSKKHLSNKRRVLDITDSFALKSDIAKESALLLSGKQIDIREGLARNELFKNWQKYPVYLNNDNEIIDEQTASAWHVCASTNSLNLGFKIAVKKIAYPKQLSSSGAFPVRIWVDNIGTSPMYEKLNLSFFVGNDNKALEIVTNDVRVNIGDTIINTIGKLPQLKTAEHDLFFSANKNGQFVKLANDMPIVNNMYKIGKISVDDNNRDFLFNAWDNYYPEGYYPLEDPKLPY